VAATFFDANGDGALDLYVVSGGADSLEPTFYQDRLYINDRAGGFRAAPSDALPPITSSGATVAPHDVDGDGDTDLFVGGRVVPGAYPETPRSYLLQNDGTGRFTDVTAAASEQLSGEGLERPGMVTAAVWADLTGDGRSELILAGEWMAVRVFTRGEGGAFAEVSEEVGLAETGGWWESLLATDVDGDGDVDVVAGNRGENGQIDAAPDAPARAYAADFDGDGQVDPLMSHMLNGTEYPIPMRDALLNQVPSLALHYPDYTSYAGATMGDVLEALGATSSILRLEAHTFASSVFINEGGRLRRHALPALAQLAPVRGWAQADIDGDGQEELLGAGNDYTMRTQWGRQDAGKGVVLRPVPRAGREGAAGAGSEDGVSLRWTALPIAETGAWGSGDVRSVARVETDRGPLIIVGVNDGPLRVWAVQTDRERAPSATLADS
jgi:hypothetical protein